jgi:MFS family permease
VVALPAVQAEFGVARADASLPYTLAMIGFGIGAVAIGRLVDRFGIVRPLMAATLLLSLGFIVSGLAPDILVFSIAHVLIGVGSSGAFAPLIADVSHWFTRRRALRSRSVPRGTIWAARCGRRSCSA